MTEDVGRRRFATTRWSLILAAAGPGSATAESALASLCEIYWFPVYAFVRRTGVSNCGDFPRPPLRIAAHAGNAKFTGKFQVFYKLIAVHTSSGPGIVAGRRERNGCRHWGVVTAWPTQADAKRGDARHGRG